MGISFPYVGLMAVPSISWFRICGSLKVAIGRRSRILKERFVILLVSIKKQEKYSLCRNKRVWDLGSSRMGRRSWFRSFRLKRGIQWHTMYLKRFGRR